MWEKKNRENFKVISTTERGDAMVKLNKPQSTLSGLLSSSSIPTLKLTTERPLR